MPNTPNTPVKVPPSAASHSAATLDPDLRSQINALLLKEGHVQKIQENLLHSLNSNSSNWPTLIQSHALHLLRSGEVTTFPALLNRVLEDVRADTVNRPTKSNDASAKTNGDSAAGSKDKKGTNGVSATSSGTGTPAGQDQQPPSLALPSAVVDEMVDATREGLEAVCEIDGTNGS